MAEPARRITPGDGATASGDAPPMSPVQAVAPSAEEEIAGRLLSRAFLYEHPADYRSGVLAAVAALRNGDEGSAPPVVGLSV